MRKLRRGRSRPISVLEALERRTLLSAAIHALASPSAPKFTSAADATFHTGQAETFTVTTSGFSSGTLTESAPLPSGLSFDAAGNGTATISGTPAAGTGGVDHLVLFAGATEQAFTLTVDQPLVFTSSASTTFAVGGADSFGIVVTAFPNATVSENGSLPRGVKFESGKNGTAELAGTPAAKTGGTFDLVFKAHNGVSPDVTQNFVLTVDQPAAFTSKKSDDFVIGQAGTFTVATSGPPTATSLSETVTLPAGLTFTNNGDGTGTLAGTPSVSIPGSYGLTFSAFNGIGNPAIQSFTLVMEQAPTITSADALTLTADVPGAFTITTSGFPLPKFETHLALPHGLHLKDDHDGTATLYGTPGATSGGTYTLSLQASNNVVAPATQSFTLTIEQGPIITSPTHVHFVSGVPTTFTFTTSGFPAAQITEIGLLPTGLSFTNLGDGTATLTGPLRTGTSGTYILHLGAQNSVSSTTQTFTITVN